MGKDMSRGNVTDITIIVPSLNPDEKLIGTLDGIFEKGFKKVVVVDDGSDEQHKQPFTYAKEKGCTVLVHEVNKGKGRALKTAFEYCLTDAGCIGVITVDGDGQHAANDIYRCGEAMLAAENKRVILGCRDFSEEQEPLRKLDYQIRISGALWDQAIGYADRTSSHSGGISACHDRI